MAKKRVSKKSSTKVGTKNLSTKNILIIIIVVAVILLIISSYTGNAARKGFKSAKSAKSMGNSGALPASGSGGSRGSGSKTPPHQVVPCSNDNVRFTGRSRCDTTPSGQTIVLGEFRCEGRDNYVGWRSTETCRDNNQVCQVNGDSASCVDVECENTVTHECINHYGRSYASYSITRDCRGREISRVIDSELRTCENSIVTSEYYGCSDREEISNIQTVTYNCGGGCNAQGTRCCNDFASNEICEGNNLMNVTTSNCLGHEISRNRIGAC